MIRIALIAYAVSNKYGSEYSVGWEFIKHMSQTGKFLITVYYGSCKGGTMGPVEELPNLNNVIWKCIELPDNYWNKLYWFIRKNIYYVFGFYFQFKEWHKYVSQHIEADNLTTKFDIVHYLNPIGIKEPGYSYNLNIPYVWGPVQGVENWPLCLFNILTLKGRIEGYVRMILQNFSLKHSLRLKKAINITNVILGATPDTCIQLKELFKKKSVYLPENGLEDINVSNNCQIRKYEKDSILQLIWVGELSCRKGLIILLMALNSLESKYKHRIHLSVLGDGCQRKQLQCYVDQNNLSSTVSFYGKVSRTEVSRRFKQSHLHIITSLSEATTTVIWEAKVNGIPTMTLDHCGMSGVVDEVCGIKISIVNMSQVIEDIASNIKRIINNPLVIESLSGGVFKTNEKFLWSERCKVFQLSYEEAIDNFNTKKTSTNSKPYKV